MVGAWHRGAVVTLCCLAALLGVALGAQATVVEFFVANLPNEPGVDEGTTVSLSNGGADPVPAVVEDQAGHVATLTVPAGGSVTYDLSGRLDGTQRSNTGAYVIKTESSIGMLQWSPIGNERSGGHSNVLHGLHEEYWVVAPEDNMCRLDCRVFTTIVGTQDGTTLTITPSSPTLAGGGVPALSTGTPWTTTIDRLEAIHIESEQALTGTHITASADVAVWAGLPCTYDYRRYCDHASEQLWPAPTEFSRGINKFVYCNTPARDGDWTRIHVIATQGGTTSVRMNGAPLGVLTYAGDAFDTYSKDHVYIEADQDIHVVAQYWDGKDPALAWVPSLGMPIFDMTYYAASGAPGATWNNAVYLFHDGATVAVDGNVVTAPVEPITGTSYVCQHEPLSAGTHRLHSMGTFGAQWISLHDETSYATHLWVNGTFGIKGETRGCGSLEARLLPRSYGLESTMQFYDEAFNLIGSYRGTVGADWTSVFGRTPAYITWYATGPFGERHYLFDDEPLPGSSCPAVDLPTVQGRSVTVMACGPRVSFDVAAQHPSGGRLWWATAGDLPPGARFADGTFSWRPHHRTGTWSFDVIVMSAPPGTLDVDGRDADGALRRATATVDVVSRACPAASGPSDADGDGDGVIDAHDNCPMVANAGAQGAVDCGALGIDDALGHEEHPVLWDGLRVGDCVLSLPLDARAKRMPNETVRIRWTWDGLCPRPCIDGGPEDCHDVRFAVWNGTAGTELVAVVPFRADGLYEAWNGAPWGGGHRYEVQVLYDASGEAGPGDVRHDLRAVRPTNLVGPCHCPLTDEPVNGTGSNTDGDERGRLHDDEVGVEAVASGRDVPFGGLVPLLAIALAAWRARPPVDRRLPR